MRRGKAQLIHMSKATTFNNDSPVKFTKRIVSPLIQKDGSVLNRAAGNNDIGAMIKMQFDPNINAKLNAFAELH